MNVATSPPLHEDLTTLIRNATKAVLSFWDEGSASFLRDSRTQSDESIRTSPTSSVRCIQALTDYLYFAELHPDRSNDLEQQCLTVMKAFVAKHGDLPALTEWLASGANKKNSFTLHHAIAAFALLAAVGRQLGRQELIPDSQIIPALVADLAQMSDPEQLSSFGGLAYSRAATALALVSGRPDHPKAEDATPVSEGSDRRQANDANMPSKMTPRQEEELEMTVASQLGFLASGATWRFDLMVLASSAALLSTHQSLAPNPLAAAALQKLPDLQRDDGTWFFARAVTLSRGGALYVSSHEIGLTLVNAALNADTLRLEERVALLAPLVDSLNRSARLAELSRQEVRPADDDTSYCGWANEQLQGDGVIESWTTAVVTQFLIRLVVLRHRFESDEGLLQLDALGCGLKDRPAERRKHEWSDLFTIARPSRKLSFDFVSDATRDGVLSPRIQAELINPVARSWVYRPPIQGQGVASLIVPGPPGSRKTSLMKEVAKVLGWPLLTVTPSVLLRSGLEGFEQRSDEVFTKLMSLRRVVVFFDECEELIRNRKAPDGSVSSGQIRTMAAFTTAGMLTRLQELRDQGWVIFAFATNADSDELDSAARRPGRFDGELRLLYPTREARRRYILRKLDRDIPFGLIEDAVKQGVAERIASNTGGDGSDETEWGKTKGSPFSLLDAVLVVATEAWLASEEDRDLLSIVTMAASKVTASPGPRNLLEKQ